MNQSTNKIKGFVDYKKTIYESLSESVRDKFDRIIFSSANKSTTYKSYKIKLYEILNHIKSIKFYNKKNKLTNINSKRTFDFIIAEKYPNNFLTNKPFYDYLEKNGYSLFYYVSDSVDSLVASEAKIIYTHNNISVIDLLSILADLFQILNVSIFRRQIKAFKSYFFTIFSDLIDVHKIKKNTHLIKNVKANYLIVSEDHSINNRTLIKTSKCFNKCVFLQHGLIDIEKVKKSGLYQEHIFNKAIIWGDYYLDAFNNENHQICSVGSIKHSELLRKYDFRTNEQDKSILIVSTPPTGKALNAEMVERLTTSFMEYARQLKDYNFYYKLHHAEQMLFYQKFTPPSNFKFINPEINIYELIMHCKHVVVTASTIGHEAYLFDKNLILVDVGYNHVYPFAQKIVKQGDFESFKNALASHVIQVDNQKDFYIKTSRNIHQEILSAILN